MVDSSRAKTSAVSEADFEKWPGIAPNTLLSQHKERQYSLDSMLQALYNLLDVLRKWQSPLSALMDGQSCLRPQRTRRQPIVSTWNLAPRRHHMRHRNRAEIMSGTAEASPQSLTNTIKPRFAANGGHLLPGNQRSQRHHRKEGLQYGQRRMSRMQEREVHLQTRWCSLRKTYSNTAKSTTTLDSSGGLHGCGWLRVCVHR